MADAGHRSSGRRASSATSPSATSRKPPSLLTRRKPLAARNSSSSCRSTPRGGCTGTFAWSGKARCVVGPCPRARRSIRPTSASPSKSKTIPIAYAKFEGDIPKGQYGGGHVDIWDNGTWEPVGDFAKGLKKGHLEFEMFGKKLSGRWHLVRTRMQGKQPNWLLMKSGDFAARAGADADVIDAGGADDPKRMLRPRTRARPRARRSPSAVARPSRAAARRSGTRGKRAARQHQAACSRRSSTRCPATKAGCTSSSTTACACCAAATATTCAASRATASTGRTRSGPWSRRSRS